MVEFIRNLFRRKSVAPPPAVPGGERVYAIGDIHGRLDLFSALIQAIEQDDRARGSADTTVILLGDLVDRGPASAEVVNAAREWSTRRKVRIIAGNHEEIFLLSFYDLDAFRSLLRFGGRETVLSYGVDPGAFFAAELEQAQQMMIDAVPRADRAFIHEFEKTIAIGDYLFVHAGIRPGRPVEQQEASDCRWIREPFLSHGGDHGCVVVHGHTITAEADIRHNRIGIDTGAYASGRLTALGLEGTERWLIEAEDAGGTITTGQRAV